MLKIAAAPAAAAPLRCRRHCVRVCASSHKVPHDSNKPPPPFCRNCRWFRLSKEFKEKPLQVRFGECTKYGEINLVSGEMVYHSASFARPHHCRGESFEALLEGGETGNPP